jgi:serine protease
MAVGDLDFGGSLAEMYILLYDQIEGETVLDVRGVPDGSGKISYSFSQVPAGSYVVYAGTDVDNDDFICQAGEGCGSYPSLGDFVRIEVNGTDVEDIDFTADIVAGFGKLDSLATDGTSSLASEGVPRLNVKVNKALPGGQRNE